jgi:tetratricopeptide (TPR) repeat protein
MPIEALILSLAIAVQGDVVILSNGNEIQGEVLKEDGDRVVVKFQGGTLELPKKNVREIRRQKRIEYLLEEGEKLSRRGDHDEAVEAALEATEAEPDSQRARSALLDTSEKRALHLADLGRYEEARDSFVSLLKLDPSNATAKEEIQVIDKILEDARLEEQKGRAEVASGNLELGVWRLKKIFDNFPGRRKEVGPVLAAGYVRQGDILLRKQAWTEAEALYLQALAADPESVILLRAQFSFSKAKRIEPLVGRGEFPRSRSWRRKAWTSIRRTSRCATTTASRSRAPAKRATRPRSFLRSSTSNGLRTRRKWSPSYAVRSRPASQSAARRARRPTRAPARSYRAISASYARSTS